LHARIARLADGWHLVPGGRPLVEGPVGGTSVADDDVVPLPPAGKVPAAGYGAGRAVRAVDDVRVRRSPDEVEQQGVHLRRGDVPHCLRRSSRAVPRQQRVGHDDIERLLCVVLLPKGTHFLLFCTAEELPADDDFEAIY